MARHKMVDGVSVPLTEADEAEIAKKETEWEKNRPARKATLEIRNLEKTITQRRIREMTTDAGKQWVNNVEELIAIERGKL
mgnify:CR=1 FL=1